MNRHIPKHIVWICSFLIMFSAVAADSNSVVPPAFRMPTANTRLENVTFVIFDTETTGFSPAKDRLVEIGAVKVRGNENLGERTWLINPERYISYYAQKVHNITPDMVKDQPTFAEIYPEFLEFIDGAVLIAHNAPFDIRFIAAEAERNGMPPPKNAVIDSLVLFRNWFPGMKSHSLTELLPELGIDISEMQAHRATDDSLFVHYVIQKEMERRSDSPRFSELLKNVGQIHRFGEE
jgi:DNA polymerase III epsilon subunit